MKKTFHGRYKGFFQASTFFSEMHLQKTQNSPLTRPNSLDKDNEKRRRARTLKINAYDMYYFINKLKTNNRRDI